MSEDYSKNIVKKYQYWTVYVHINQGYLGRCLAWCNREDAIDLTDATPEEQAELFVILPEMKRVIEKAFDADWMNYSFLGNEMRHLHGHIVPRYQSQRVFEGQTFIDDRWGKNWLLDENFQTSPELLQAIKRKLQDNLK